MPRIPLPSELRGSAIRTTSAGDHDLTVSRLRGPDVAHPFRGVSSVGLDLRSMRDRCTAFLPVMEPGQTFSHTTALALHGSPLPELTDGLHVSVRFPRTPPCRPGVIGHALRDAPLVMSGGFPVAPPAIAWAQSAAVLGRDDLTAVADHLLLGRTDPAELTAIARGWRGRPGSGRLAWAAAAMRAGVRSRPETHLRLLLVGARLPEPMVGFPVTVRSGVTLHPDLAYPDRRLALEYEGRGHRAEGTWESDIERRELLAEVGWRTVRVTARQLYRDSARLVARIRRHLSA